MSWTSFVRAAATAETDRVKAQVRAAVRSLVLMVVAAFLLLIGVTFVLVGVYSSLAETLPGWQAGGVVGVAVLALSLLLVMLAKKRDGSRRRARAPGGYRSAPPGPPGPPGPPSAGPDLGAAAGRGVADFVREHRPTVAELALAAFVVGLVASRRPRRRREE